jgi:hypothetical protein
MTHHLKMNIEFNSSSMLLSPIVVDTEAGTATLTYKNSGKDYTYSMNETFVNDLQNVITNEESVGKFILSARADRRLTEVATA